MDVREPEVWDRVRAALNGDDGVASSGDDEVMSNAAEFASPTEAFPSLKNSPLFSLQQLSATVPFPQQ